MSSTIKPTVIKTGNNQVEAPRPSVIRVSDPESVHVPTPASVTPTVIKVGAKEEKVGVEKAPAFEPTKMSGFERNRLHVKMEELKRKFPEATDAMTEKALQYVLETDIDSMLQTSALIWQTDLQKRYSDKVLQLLECTQHPAIAKAGTHISRIIDILQAIDLQGVCEYEADGVLSKFLKQSNKEFDTPEELTHAERELKQLTQLLGDQLKALLVLQHKLHGINAEIRTLANDIKAAGMAALFLADYLPKKNAKYGKIADQFHERGMSLFQTEVQIFENELARDSQHAHPIKLIEMIQNTILVMIPDWLGSVASLRAMIEMNKKVTVTEIEEISDWKKRIIKHLK